MAGCRAMSSMVWLCCQVLHFVAKIQTTDLCSLRTLLNLYIYCNVNSQLLNWVRFLERHTIYV